MLLGGVGLEMMNSHLPLPADVELTASSSLAPDLNDSQFYPAALVLIGIPFTIGACTLSDEVLFAETAYRNGVIKITRMHELGHGESVI